MTDYWISPTGNDSTGAGTLEDPWLTPGKVIAVPIAAGETCWFMDGTYTSGIDTLSTTISGTAEAGPVSFKAINDGLVTIDMSSSGWACRIKGTVGDHQEYIDIEGIVFLNPDDWIIYIAYCDYINVKRCSAYSTNDAIDKVSIMVESDSSYVLIEDCVARGSGRYVVQVGGGTSHHITFRRVLSWYVEGSSAQACFVLYAPDDCLLENCIAAVDTACTDTPWGFAVGNSTYDSDDRHTFIGNIARGIGIMWNGYIDRSMSYGKNITSNVFKHCVATGCKMGIYQGADDNAIFQNMTLIGSDKTWTINGVFVWPDLADDLQNDPDFECNGDYKDISIVTANEGFEVIQRTTTDDDYIKTFTQDYINIYDANTVYRGQNWTLNEGANSTQIDPNYDTATYGDGAYLMASQCDLKDTGSGGVGTDMGAEVLYRYQDGVLTSERLWPWPMEARILAEFSSIFSETYNAT